MWICPDESVKTHAKPPCNCKHAVARLHRVACGTRRTTWRGRHSRHTDPLPGEDQVRVGNLRICRNQSIQADPKSLSDKEHRISGLYYVHKSVWRTVTGRWRCSGRYTHCLPWNNHVWVRNLRIGCNQSVQAHSKPLGDEKHCIPRLYYIGKRVWRTQRCSFGTHAVCPGLIRWDPESGDWQRSRHQADSESFERSGTLCSGWTI